MINPLSRPDHFIHKRGPRTEAEVDEVQGWKWSAVREIEAHLWLLEHAPDLADQVSSDFRLPDVVRTYSAGRDAAMRIGRELPDFGFSLADVEVVRQAQGGGAGVIDMEARTAMLEAARAGRLPYPEWLAGKQCAKGLAAVRSRVAGARSALQLRPSGLGVDERSTLGSFAEELALVTETR